MQARPLSGLGERVRAGSGGGWPGEEEAQLAGCCYGICAEEILLRGLCGHVVDWGLEMVRHKILSVTLTSTEMRDQEEKTDGWRSQAKRGLLSNKNSCH